MLLGPLRKIKSTPPIIHPSGRGAVTGATCLNNLERLAFETASTNWYRTRPGGVYVVVKGESDCAISVYGRVTVEKNGAHHPASQTRDRVP